MVIYIFNISFLVGHKKKTDSFVPVNIRENLSTNLSLAFAVLAE
jgi:hypothetical protein